MLRSRSIRRQCTSYPCFSALHLCRHGLEPAGHAAGPARPTACPRATAGGDLLLVASASSSRARQAAAATAVGFPLRSHCPILQLLVFDSLMAFGRLFEYAVLAYLVSKIVLPAYSLWAFSFSVPLRIIFASTYLHLSLRPLPRKFACGQVCSASEHAPAIHAATCISLPGGAKPVHAGVYTHAYSVCASSRPTAAAVAARTPCLFLPIVFARPAGIRQQP